MLWEVGSNGRTGSCVASGSSVELGLFINASVVYLLSVTVL